jgi:aminoglycoside phosphotransferase (APT) family kinase protein
MEVSIDKLRERVEILQSVCRFQHISKGFSMEQKYMVTTESGDKLLLRVMPVEQFNRKEAEFRIIQQMYSANVKETHYHR